MSLSVLHSPGSSAPAVRGTGWDPFQEFADMHERFNQLVQSAFGSGMGAALPDLAGAGTARAWRPFADVSETADAFIVEVEVPGVARDDLVVEAIGTELVVRGEYKEERTGLSHSRTRRIGQLEYRTLLPQEVNADAITADLADGVLTLRIPKAETVMPHRIEITAR